MLGFSAVYGLFLGDLHNVFMSSRRHKHDGDVLYRFCFICLMCVCVCMHVHALLFFFFSFFTPEFCFSAEQAICADVPQCARKTVYQNQVSASPFLCLPVWLCCICQTSEVVDRETKDQKTVILK